MKSTAEPYYYGLKRVQVLGKKLYSRMAFDLTVFEAQEKNDPSGPRWCPGQWERAGHVPGFHAYPIHVKLGDLQALDEGALQYGHHPSELWVAKLKGSVYYGIGLCSVQGQYCRLVTRICRVPAFAGYSGFDPLVRWREENLRVGETGGTEIRISNKWVPLFTQKDFRDLYGENRG